MSDKSLPDGRPHMIFLQDILDARFGTGATQVVCPITDAFVRHHGALGGFVRVWIHDPQLSAAEVIAHVAPVPGIVKALDRAAVSARYEPPADREGDVAVQAEQNVVMEALPPNTISPPSATPACVATAASARRARPSS